MINKDLGIYFLLITLVTLTTFNITSAFAEPKIPHDEVIQKHLQENLERNRLYPEILIEENQTNTSGDKMCNEYPYC